MVRPQVVWEPCTRSPQRYGVVVRLLVLCATSWRLNGTKKVAKNVFSHLLKFSLYVSFPKLFAVLGSFKTVTAVLLHRVSRIPEGKSFQQPCWSMNKQTVQYEIASVYVPVSQSPEILYHKYGALRDDENLTVGQLYTLNWLCTFCKAKPVCTDMLSSTDAPVNKHLEASDTPVPHVLTYIVGD